MTKPLKEVMCGICYAPIHRESALVYCIQCGKRHLFCRLTQHETMKGCLRCMQIRCVQSERHDIIAFWIQELTRNAAKTKGFGYFNGYLYEAQKVRAIDDNTIQVGPLAVVPVSRDSLEHSIIYNLNKHR